jgi:MerR family mercuric resistance operon transcriptional regulator
MARPDRRFLIGLLSERTGCKVETIRYYERVRLLPRPARTAGGFRLYTLAYLKRLAFIRRARGLGFTIREVRTLLGLAEMRRRRPPRGREAAAALLHEVETKLADLGVLQRILTELATRRAAGPVPADCLIAALFRDRDGRGRATPWARSSAGAG